MALYSYKDGVDLASVTTIPELGGFKSNGNRYLSKAGGHNWVGNTPSNNWVLASGCAFDIYIGDPTVSYDRLNWKTVVNRGSITFSPEASQSGVATDGFKIYGLGSGALKAASTFGKDLYVYLGFNTSDLNIPCLITSLNATAPTEIAGFTVNNTRKIGGGHYGAVRKVNSDWAPIGTDNAAFGTGWANNIIGAALDASGYPGAIIPNSVWDLANRPSNGLTEGMAKVGSLWYSIYQLTHLGPGGVTPTFKGATNGSFIANGKLVSAYGFVPTTGTEGCCWYSFNELLARSGMRLPNYAEWCQGAYGQPGGDLNTGNDYGWTTGNSARKRTGVRVNAADGLWNASGLTPYAVSAYNLCDCNGNVWEWIENVAGTQTNSETTFSWGWTSIGSDANLGQGYLPSTNGLQVLIAGGGWNNASDAGARAVIAGAWPWDVSTNIGVRGVCDAA